MKTKIMVLLLCALLFAPCFSAEAQQPTKIPRIGFIASTSPADRNLEAFREGLRDLGYISGKNISIEYRFAEGKEDRFPVFVSDLLKLKVDVLISSSSPAIYAAKQATNVIPIVMVTTVDPVATGLVDSLAHPGGNITGI